MQLYLHIPDLIRPLRLRIPGPFRLGALRTGYLHGMGEG